LHAAIQNMRAGVTIQAMCTFLTLTGKAIKLPSGMQIKNNTTSFWIVVTTHTLQTLFIFGIYGSYDSGWWDLWDGLAVESG